MRRNFGNMSRPASLSGASSADRPASLGNYAPSDSILLRDIPSFERGDLSDADNDILASVRLVALMLLIGAVIGAFVFGLMLIE